MTCTFEDEIFNATEFRLEEIQKLVKNGINKRRFNSERREFYMEHYSDIEFIYNKNEIALKINKVAVKKSDIDFDLFSMDDSCIKGYESNQSIIVPEINSILKNIKKEYSNFFKSTQFYYSSSGINYSKILTCTRLLDIIEDELKNLVSGKVFYTKNQKDYSRVNYYIRIPANEYAYVPSDKVIPYLIKANPNIKEGYLMRMVSKEYIENFEKEYNKMMLSLLPKIKSWIKCNDTLR